MKAMVPSPPIGLDQLLLEDRPNSGAPGAGETRVALHGSSLSFHDLGVATGRMPTAGKRIPLADGAGLVEAVGAGITEFRPGDMVASVSFPDWHDGTPTIGDFRRSPATGSTALRRSMSCCSPPPSRTLPRIMMRSNRR